MYEVEYATIGGISKGIVRRAGQGYGGARGRTETHLRNPWRYDQPMSFSRDLDLNGFKQAFEDDDIRPLLGIDVASPAAKKIVANKDLIEDVYNEWKRTHTGAGTPTTQQAGAGNASRPESAAASRSMSGTGLWAAILAVILALAAWVAMSIGLTLADAHRIRENGYLLSSYGEESVGYATGSLIWASLFTVGALIFSITAVRRGRASARAGILWGGVIGAILSVFLIMVIVFQSVHVSTWLS